MVHETDLVDALPGFGPGLPGPKPGVLPLHHNA